MFRCKLDGRELIVRIVSKSVSESDQFAITDKVLSLGNKLFDYQDKAVFAIEMSENKLIVAEIEMNQIVVITIRHIVEMENVFCINASSY